MDTFAFRSTKLDLPVLLTCMRKINICTSVFIHVILLSLSIMVVVVSSHQIDSNRLYYPMNSCIRFVSVSQHRNRNRNQILPNRASDSSFTSSPKNPMQLKIRYESPIYLFSFLLHQIRPLSFLWLNPTSCRPRPPLLPVRGGCPPNCGSTGFPRCPRRSDRSWRRATWPGTTGWDRSCTAPWDRGSP